MDYVSVAILILRLYLFTNFQICLYLENSILGCKSPGRQVAEIAKSRFTLKSTVLRAIQRYKRNGAKNVKLN